MKKFLVIALSTSLLVPGFSANAADKAGTACPKAGKTSTANGRIYTCIKLGSKLYWNNGKIVKSNSSNNKSNSTASGTVSQQNASKKAASYLRNSAFSRSSLIAQLEFEGFSNSDAIFGTDPLRANWTEQAIKKAASYLRNSSFSRSSLIAQLEYEGFSNADAPKGTDSQKADWNEQAALKAASYLRNGAFSRSGLMDQLEYEGFSQSEAEYGVSKTGL
ncbi:MAG: Ltp family lipoprotein [Candidatus Nanopelagicaceae bacterium]